MVSFKGRHLMEITDTLSIGALMETLYSILLIQDSSDSTLHKRIVSTQLNIGGKT
jgi:hypothetical protein